MRCSDFNLVITYVEDHLEEPIDIHNVSKLVGMNDFIFQRIFCFLTGITFTEYVKMRRLSKAYEDIKNSHDKIIDIALKYQFQSISTFNRSFKNLFSITPTECRNRSVKYEMVPIINFDHLEQNELRFEYEIKNVDETNLFCYHVMSDDHAHLLYQIRKLYQQLQSTDRYDAFNQNGMYGVFLMENGIYHYYIGTTLPYDDLTLYCLPAGKYVVFRLKSRTQEAILNLLKKVYAQWFSSTHYSKQAGIDFEYYEGDYCDIYISIY